MREFVTEYAEQAWPDASGGGWEGRAEFYEPWRKPGFRWELCPARVRPNGGTAKNLLRRRRHLSGEPGLADLCSLRSLLFDGFFPPGR